MSYNDKRMPVMDAVCRHRGLCGEIARRIGSNRNAVWHWIRVPLAHARVVAQITGLPIEIIKDEHNVPLEKFRISTSELRALPETTKGYSRSRGVSLPHVGEKLLELVETTLAETVPTVDKSITSSVANKLNALRRTG